MGSIEEAQLAIFGISLLPACYVFYKHGKPGFLGWLYVVLFCVIRIVGNAMLIYYQYKGVLSEMALIISSLGLSPLLLSSLGILHEARRARNHRLRGFWEWFLVLNFHGIQAVGIALIASRGSALASNQRSSLDQSLLDVGLAIIDAYWGFLAFAVLMSLATHGKSNLGRRLYSQGSELLYFVLIGTCLVLLRVVYATVYYVSGSMSFKTSLATKVCLDVVPEMLITCLYLWVGVMTRNMHHVEK